MVNNIKETFANANLEKIEVRDKKIAKVIYTPLFQSLSDFRLVAQIREEIEKVKPSLVFVV
ncbi:MAG: hypothetical protein V1810_03540 [Candidatus Beckwithbacteria bacterium]